jgi:hypothetical protein
MTEEDFLKKEKIALITSINARVDGIYNFGIGVHICGTMIYKTDIDNDNPIIDAEILAAEMREKANTLLIVDEIEHKNFKYRRDLKTIIKEFLDNRENYMKVLEDPSVHHKTEAYYKSANYDKLEKLIKEDHLEPKENNEK